MEIRRTAVAGSLESNDVLVLVNLPEGQGVTVSIDSIVIKQYGKQIEKSVLEVAAKLGVDKAHFKLTDRGALDYTIRARVETAILRAAKEETV
ncbi:MAG: citrate lyase acyl carrier protein [Deltaproteobacteria bacterium]|nr:citrate lyase acyl carrier protein [Deltaproteobacteria bacterium]